MLSIEVGKTYLNEQGDKVTIRYTDKIVRDYAYLGSDVNYYDKNGETSIWGRGLDLVEEYQPMTDEEHRALYKI